VEFGASAYTDLFSRLCTNWAQASNQTDTAQGNRQGDSADSAPKTTMGHVSNPLVLECRFEESGSKIWNTSIEWLVEIAKPVSDDQS